MDPSEIERTYNIRNCRLGFIESMFMKTKITALPQSTTLFLGKLEKAVSTLCAYDNSPY